jgi:putative ABC transport system substrate-binding protein
MRSINKHRDPVVLLIAVALFAPMLVADAQPTGKVARIGYLDDFALGPTSSTLMEAFTSGLRELGWVEGRNLVIEKRITRSRDDRPQVVGELVGLRPDVIVVSPSAAFVVAPTPKQPVPGWTPIRTIPIVFTAVSDPIGAGLVASLARPETNMTGLMYMGIELNPKRLELLKEALPGVTRIGVLVPGLHPLRDRILREIDLAARAMKLTLHRVEVTPSDPPTALEAGFATFTRERVGAVLGLQGAHYYRDRSRICELARKHAIPGIFEVSDYAEAGCLMTYAPSLTDLLRRAAGYVDRILKGARPEELPVEQPTKFEFVINLKTAKALGVTIPPSLLIRADRVIE